MGELEWKLSLVVLMERWRHVVSKFRRVISIKKAVKDKKESNILVEFKKEKTAGKRKEVDAI